MLLNLAHQFFEIKQPIAFNTNSAMKSNISILLLNLVFSGFVMLSCSDQKNTSRVVLVDKDWKFESM